MTKEANTSELDIDQYTKTLEKRFGKGIVNKATEVAKRPKVIVPVTPMLDIGLSGGIPQGSWVLCSGKPKCGKSTLSLHFARNCQRAGMPVFYLDVEGRIKEMQLTGIPGLDLDKIEVISSQEGKILTAEDYLTIGEDIAKSVPRCLLIIDSTSALCSSNETVNDISGQTRSLTPKLLAAFCRRLANIVPVNKIIVWNIQHIIANTSGKGIPFTEDGGNKIIFQGDVKIRAKYFADWKLSETATDLIGQCTKWDIEFSALGPPGRQSDMWLRYGKGIDEVWEWMQLGLELGVINSDKKPWYSLEPIGLEIKRQGAHNLHDYLIENLDVAEKLQTKVKEML